MLIIDTRESIKKKVEKLAVEKGVETKVENLSVGDFLWKDENIIIERKAIGDFVSSIKSGHLFSQLRDMQQYSERYLFVSGSISQYKKAQYFNKKNVHLTVDQELGIYCSIVGHYDVKMIQFENDTQLIKGIFKIRDSILKRCNGGDAPLEIERTTKHPNKAVQMYMSIDGMGLKRAEALAELYPNPLEFFAWSYNTGINELMEYKGIPKSVVSKKSRDVLERYKQ